MIFHGGHGDRGRCSRPSSVSPESALIVQADDEDWKKSGDSPWMRRSMLDNFTKKVLLVWWMNFIKVLS